MFLLRAFTVWLVIIIAETFHGILRAIFLQPLTGDFQARQISVFTGSLMILIITFLFIRWIHAETTKSLFAVGFMWLTLTVLFELILGRVVMGVSWERIVSDYNIARGGLLPIGFAVLTFAPFITAKVRGIKTENKGTKEIFN